MGRKSRAVTFCSNCLDSISPIGKREQHLRCGRSLPLFHKSWRMVVLEMDGAELVRSNVVDTEEEDAFLGHVFK